MEGEGATDIDGLDDVTDAEGYINVGIVGAWGGRVITWDEAVDLWWLLLPALDEWVNMACT